MLLKNGADIEAIDYQERTPLFLACEHGRDDVAKLLIAEKARIEVTNKYGQKCLYWLIAKCPDLVSLTKSNLGLKEFKFLKL